MNEDLITIGKVLKPLGLQGEVKVVLLTDFPERFDDLETVTIRRNEVDFLQLDIARVRHGAPFVYLSFVGLTDLAGVRPLQGALLQVPASERVVLREGRYFHSDLLGMDVYRTSGLVLGKISDIIETGSRDVFVVSNGTKEFMIPAHPKFVVSVDLLNNRIVVDPVEGLLDL